MNKVKNNWIHIIKEHMEKSMRLSDYHYPYAILISKFLHYFEVNLEGETSELVKSTFEVHNGSLSKMGFTKINGKWVSMDTRFQTFDEQIEVVQNQIFELQYGKED